jgi:hypothetical protein
VYDFPLDFAKKLDVIAIRYLKAWVGLYSKADTGVLFRSRSELGLGFARPSLLLKQMQLVKLQLVKHSKEGPDGPLHNLYLRRLERELKFTRRWKPCPTLEAAENKLCFDTKFAGQTDRVGLGNNRDNQILSLKDRRKSISADLAHDLDRKAVIHSMALSQQCSWTKWRSDVSPPDHKWQDLIFLNNPKIFSHYLNASIYSLPSPNRLHSWGFIPSAKCPLCDNPKGTQMHIFSNCKTALKQGRYS